MSIKKIIQEVPEEFERELPQLYEESISKTIKTQFTISQLDGQIATLENRIAELTAEKETLETKKEEALALDK